MSLEPSFRKGLLQKILATPKEQRGEVLVEARKSSDYQRARNEHIRESQQEESIEDGFGVLLKVKTLYHGSGVRGIHTFDSAENDTVGSGVYFTSKAEDAIGYARRRARREKEHQPIIYETVVENIKLLDLRQEKNLQKILPGFADKLFAEYQESTAKNNDIVTHYGKVLMRVLQTIEANQISIANLREITFSTGTYFSEYVKSLGFDGLVILEGGEGGEVGNHDTYLIFDPEKVRINREQVIS